MSKEGLGPKEGIHPDFVPKGLLRAERAQCEAVRGKGLSPTYPLNPLNPLTVLSTNSKITITLLVIEIGAVYMREAVLA